MTMPQQAFGEYNDSEVLVMHMIGFSPIHGERAPNGNEPWLSFFLTVKPLLLAMQFGELTASLEMPPIWLSIESAAIIIGQLQMTARRAGCDTRLAALVDQQHAALSEWFAAGGTAGPPSSPPACPNHGPDDICPDCTS